MKYLTPLLAGFALFTALATPTAVADDAAPADHSQQLAQELAERYGLGAWAGVEKIEFTFDVHLGDRHIVRPWQWDVKARTVTANFGRPDAVTFSLDHITDDVKEHHRHFVNDSYWLLFPLYVAWTDNTVTDQGQAAMPISGKPARKLTVRFPGDGGYTPGDAYDLYLDPGDGFIREWVYRKGGGEAGRPATWEDRIGLNGLVITRSHRGPDGGGFRLSFPVVRVYAHDAVAVAGE